MYTTCLLLCFQTWSATIKIMFFVVQRRDNIPNKRDLRLGTTWHTNCDPLTWIEFHCQLLVIIALPGLLRTHQPYLGSFPAFFSGFVWIQKYLKVTQLLIPSGLANQKLRYFQIYRILEKTTKNILENGWWIKRCGTSKFRLQETIKNVL